MAEKFNPQETDRKWQQRWEADGLYRTPDDSDKPKYYFLTMYPYPSGDLHTGHWYAEAPADTKARYLRMRGYNVLFPMGFDAFGLPAENAAIRNNIHPFQWTMANIDRMRNQFKSMGAMFDWSREVITCLPEYYTWNQWFFLQFYKKGLAYRARAAVDFCPNCNTTLAREQVWGEDRRCERCGTQVEKRDLEQWFFRITDYADELLRFDGLDWPDRVKTMQTNWIGRSEGAEIAFVIEPNPPTPSPRREGGVLSDVGGNDIAIPRTDELLAPSVDEDSPPLRGEGPGERSEIRVFTTRPDTIYGVSFMVLAPEHPLVEQLTTPEQAEAVREYIEQARRETEIERTAADKPKTGVFTGAYCINPYSGERVPVYVGDYVLYTYGTGAVMGVPAHDERDFAFAKTYSLPIPVVIAPSDWTGAELDSAYTEPGTMVNSGPFDGTPSEEGKKQVIAYGEERGFATTRVTYRMRDWLISRQRYWGTPIPIIYCPVDGVVPVPEEDLPVLLPEDSEFRPTGESPLKYDERFKNVSCPTCGGPAERETDTMDTFMDSSWYQYRYLSPHFAEGPFNPSKADWLPVDQYTGGIEHATMHLLYFRFFTKAMRDLGLVTIDEPVTRLINQGIILGPDSQKMSKSRGNVVNPDDYVDSLGADVFRCYLMFIGPWEDGGPYRPEGIEGVTRWLHRVWNLTLDEPRFAGTIDADATRDLQRRRHKTVRVVSEDLENFRFNTKLARLMEYTNELSRVKDSGRIDPAVWNDAVETLLLMTAPAAPHITEELWERTGRPYSVHTQAWPSFDPALAEDEQRTIVVQINGKVRDRLSVPVDATREQVEAMAMASEKVAGQIDGATVRNVVYVPGRLVNIVVT
ncbi:MAG: leucine--tRNA ligase [Dehalococcoidia bacterium]